MNLEQQQETASSPSSDAFSSNSSSSSLSSPVGRRGLRIQEKYQKHYKQDYPIAMAKARKLTGPITKLQPICRFIIGLSAREAMKQLELMDKKLAIDVLKCLKSAMFNAENHKGLNVDRLLIKEAISNKGQYLKRLNPMGRSRFGLKERTKCHLTIVLQEIPPVEGEKRLGKAGWKNSTWERSENNEGYITPEEFDKLVENLKRDSYVPIPAVSKKFGVGLSGMESLVSAIVKDKKSSVPQNPEDLEEGYAAPQKVDEDEDDDGDYKILEEENFNVESEEEDVPKKKKNKK